MPLAVIPVLRALVVAAALAAATQTGASRFALAQVLDPRGRALVDIGADDFVVSEAGATREVLDVRVADYPIVVVIDNAAAARDDFPAIRAAAARFIDRVGVRPVAIVTAGGAAAVVGDFEDDREILLSKLSAVEVAGEGQPLHAMALAAETIRRSGAFFSTIVVATASAVETQGAESDAPLASMIDSRAVVHIIHNGRAGAPAPPLFRTIADQTHGAYTPIYAAASYQPALDALATRLTTEMLIEYLVPVGSKASDVRIGVRVPGARVRGLGVAPK
jgi:hypothetical protein